MKKGTIIWISAILIISAALCVVGVVVPCIEETIKKIFFILGGIGSVASIIGLIIVLVQKPKNDVTAEPPEIKLDFETATKLADGRLQEEIALRDKTIVALQEELARKNLSSWEQKVKELLEKGELQMAIESIDTDESDYEATTRHIRKAQLYIADFNFSEAERHYKKAVEINPSYFSYLAIAGFYYDLNRFPQAIDYYGRALPLAPSPEEKAVVLNNLGNTQSKSNSLEAEKSYIEALSIYRELTKNNPDAYRPDLAMTLNNFGSWQLDNNRPEAEESYTEALKIRRELAKENPGAYRPHVAGALNNLGNWQSANNRPEAEESYTEALSIYRELAQNNPDAYRPDVAMTLNNLGNWQSDNNRAEAEESYTEALGIYRELAKKNSDAYKPDVAMTLNNLGIWQSDNKRPEAEESYTEALKIRRELTKNNPDAYQPDLAMTLVNLALYYRDNAPHKNLPLKYAREAMDTIEKCHPTQLTQQILDTANRVVEEWERRTDG
jgi:tetratricopeptide (TPR) repeat protein